MQTRGVVFIHAAPPAITPHAEWAISGVLKSPVKIRWQAQPASPGDVRGEFSWRGPSGTCSAIASALKAWPMLVFEVTEDPTAGTDGHRISHVPDRGYFSAATAANGDLVVTENQLRELRDTATSVEEFRHGLDRLLGASYDAELEIYREGGDGAHVSWIHRAG